MRTTTYPYQCILAVRSIESGRPFVVVDVKGERVESDVIEWSGYGFVTVFLTDGVNQPPTAPGVYRWDGEVDYSVPTDEELREWNGEIESESVYRGVWTKVNIAFP